MNKTNAKTTETKEREFLKVGSFKVLRARLIGKNNACTFDLELNGVTIYGLFVIENDKGDFISFPQRKADNGKYYHIAYAPLSDKDTKDIIKEVENVLNN